MAFQISTTGLPSLENYQQALARWESTEPWRRMTGEYDKRPLDRYRRRAYHKSIHKLEGGHIACRLHNTDVITYNADGTIAVEPWGSASTDGFFNTVCPSGMRSAFNNHLTIWLHTWGNRHGTIWEDGESEGYKATQGLLLRPGVQGQDRTQWVIVEGGRPWKKSVINRKRARDALIAENFPDFQIYYMAARKLSGVYEHMLYHPTGGSSCLNYLRDQSQWSVLLPCDIEEIRKVVYAQHHVTDEIELPYITRGQLMKTVY